MKTLVTGGAGFIGSHLVGRLVAEGHGVVVFDNLVTGRLENLAPWRDAIEFVRGDLRDPEALAVASRGAEVVYHQAALGSVVRSVEDPREVMDVNVTGTLNVLLAARDAGVRRVVFASSSSVYGDTPTLPKTESMPTNPRSPYAASKVSGEALVAAFQAAYGLEGVVFRYFNVYGERQSARSLYAAVVPRFVDEMSAGRAPVVYGDGEQTRDFTYVGDVVDALLLAAGSGPEALLGPINLGAGGRVSILDLARRIGEEVRFGGRPVHEAARPGDVRHSLADIARARQALGWTPRTPLAEGIRRTVAAGRAALPA
jgi:nucleoside-diphosphate-sugar epimerase